MRDHLDDPTPPAGDRAAVVARAGRRQLRRRLTWGGAGTSLAAVLVVALALAGQGSSGRPTVVSLASPSATPSETPSGAASPSAVATPTPTVTPSRTRQPLTVVGAAPVGAPSASPTCESTKYLSCPDGRPGYGEGDSLDSCHDDAAVPQGDATAELGQGVVATLTVPASVAAGTQGKGSLTFRNDGTTSARVSYLPSYGGDDGSGSDPTWEGEVIGSAVHEGHGTWPAVVGTSTLAPGESVSFLVGLSTDQCGDNQDQDDLPMAAGSYDVGLQLRYDVAPDDPGTPAPTPTAERNVRGTTALGGTLHIT